VNTGIKWGGRGLWLIARYVASIAPWINETNTELQYASTYTVTENKGADDGWWLGTFYE
jgi:hypothetical protein